MVNYPSSPVIIAPEDTIRAAGSGDVLPGVHFLLNTKLCLTRDAP